MQITYTKKDVAKKTAEKLGCTFLLSLFRTQIDLTNIKTMLRLKMADREDRNLFLDGGFVEKSRFVQGLDAGYEALSALFFATCYSDIIDGGVSYLTSKESFLGVEKLCEEHLVGFLKTTQSIASGHQPVIAYLLRKENEIRTLRMVLSCKKNGLDAKSMAGLGLSKFRLGGISLYCSASEVLISPATPAAASRCPTAVLSEPIGQKPFFSVHVR